jgi:3-hydroxybutyryl-CoA dehydrogenase
METMGVVGAGTMGCGIAQVFLEHDFNVIFNDLNDMLLKKGIAVINKNLDRSVEKGKISPETKKEILTKLTTSKELELFNKCSVVIEAVSENMETKTDIFKKLDEICAGRSILASNTSSLSITELSYASKWPEKVIGIHFFNPAPVIRLVEIIKGLRTSKETFEIVRNHILSLDKTPIEVAESPGFIVNRLLVPMINEAITVFAEGVATVSDIDDAMKSGANHPMGPLALADLIGLDVVLAIMENLHLEIGDDKYRPHPLLKKMVRGRKLGRKSGSGFYEY